jgi:predicted nucleic acid-binding protein
MYLVDTNIFLEVMLNQEKAQLVKDFFNRADFSSLFISDFSLFSIGIIFAREKNPGPFLKLVNDDILSSGMRMLSLHLDDFSRIFEYVEKFRLDFDDAYQYAIAERNGLTIVSFDQDFDRTEKGRVVPEDLFRGPS